MSCPENLSASGSVYDLDSNVKGSRHGLMKLIVLAADAVATVLYVLRGYVLNSTSTEYGGSIRAMRLPSSESAVNYRVTSL